LVKQYKIRALTRDPSKLTGQALAQGVEVVKADLEDRASVKNALQGAHTVFAMNPSIHDGGGKQKEIDQGITIADESVAAGAKYIIWSSSTNVEKITGGKLDRVHHFDSKAIVEEYIRTLPIKSAFYTPGSFMQNFLGPMWKPQPVGDGTYALSNICSGSTELPLIDIDADTGKFVGAILAEPEKYEGKILGASCGFYTIDEITQILSKVTGKTIKFMQVPEDVYRKFLPPSFATELIQMLQWFRDYGYYGPKTKELVEWSVLQARGKLTTLEEFLAKNPLNLQ